MRLTQKIIDEIAVAMQHTKMNGEVNWKDGDEIHHLILILIMRNRSGKVDVIH